MATATISYDFNGPSGVKSDDPGGGNFGYGYARPNPGNPGTLVSILGQIGIASTNTASGTTLDLEPNVPKLFRSLP